MRLPLIVCLLALSSCSGPDKWADNAAVPTLNVTSETPGDWSALSGMIGRRPSESGLIDTSAISVDLNALLGPDKQAFRSAMMRAGPLTRQGDLLVARSPDGWLVIQPEEHAMRAALRRGGRVQEWQTPGTDVPAP